MENGIIWRGRGIIRPHESKTSWFNLGLVFSLFVALSQFVLGSEVVAQDRPAQSTPAATIEVDQVSLQTFVDELHAEHGVTGLLVGVQIGENTPILLAAGESLPGQAASPEMHFRMGAMSITTMTTLLLQLVDEGKLKLDDPISKWLPDLPRADDITLMMLAATNSGYADYVSDDGFIEAFYADVFANWSIDQLVSIALDKGMLFEPGEGFQYSHANYILLGEILQLATRQTLEDLVRSRILVPLGLKQTFYRNDSALAEPVLHAYTAERDIFENSTFWSPSWTSHTGFLTGNLSNLVHLTRALASGQLLTDDSRKAMIAPINVGKAGNTDARFFALGIAILDPWIMQFFSFGGYEGSVGYLPEDDVTLAVVNTLGPDSSEGIARQVFDQLRAHLGK